MTSAAARASGSGTNVEGLELRALRLHDAHAVWGSRSDLAGRGAADVPTPKMMAAAATIPTAKGDTIALKGDQPPRHSRGYSEQRAAARPRRRGEPDEASEVGEMAGLGAIGHA